MTAKSTSRLQILGVVKVKGFSDFKAKADLAFGAITRLGGGIAAMLEESSKIESIFSAQTVSINKARKETKGLVDDLTLVTAANKAVALGIDVSEEKFASLSKAAVILGQKIGVDAKQAVDDLVTGVGRQSAQILDNLGIIVKSQDSYDKYAASIGKTSSELSASQKRIAFQTEAFEQLAAKAGDAEVNTQSLGKQFVVFKNQLTNVKNDFLKGISSAKEYGEALQALGRIAANVGKLLVRVLGGGPEKDKLRDQLLENQKAILGHRKAINDMIALGFGDAPLARARRKAIEDLQQSSRALNSQLNDIKKAAADVGKKAPGTGIAGKRTGKTEREKAGEDAARFLKQELEKEQKIMKAAKRDEKLFLEQQFREEEKLKKKREFIAELDAQNLSDLRSLELKREQADAVDTLTRSLDAQSDAQRRAAETQRMGSSAAKDFAMATLESAAAAMFAGDNIGDAIRSVIAAELRKFAILAAMHSAWNFALGLSALIPGTPFFGFAGQLFATAALFGGIAASAGAASSAIQPSRGGSSGAASASSRGRSAGARGSDLGRNVPASEGEKTFEVNVFLGSSRDRGSQILAERQIVQAANGVAEAQAV